MNMSLIKGLSQVIPAISPPGSHPNIIPVNSKGALFGQIGKLKKGEHLVVVFSASWCGACRYYKPTYKKLLRKDRGRHRFLWAQGRFTGQYARYYPDVYIVDWKGRMKPVGRYRILSTFRRLERRYRSRPKPRPRPIPTPRPAPKPKPVVRPKPRPVTRDDGASIFLKPRPRPTKRANSTRKLNPKARQGIVRFFPFGNGLFCIEVKAKAATRPKPTTSSGAACKPCGTDVSGEEVTF